MSPTELRYLEAFGLHVAHEAAPRELSPLKEIDETVAAITIEIGKFQAMALTTGHYVNVLLKSSLPRTDNVEKLQTLFVKARDAIGATYALTVKKRQRAMDDSRLTGEDGIVEVYDYLLEVISSLHNSFNSLAWIIGENIADNDTTAPGTFTNADDLFASMGG